MRRGAIAAAVAAAALGLGATTASAVVSEAVVRCENTATWQITVGATSYADLTHAAAGPGVCKTVNAGVEDDLDFNVGSGDFVAGGYTKRLVLTGAFVTGVPAFVGIGASDDGTVRGPVEITSPGSLNATLTAVEDGITWVAEYTPNGSCGTNCYATKFTLVGSWIP